MGRVTVRPLVVVVLALTPLALLAWLLATPAANQPWADAVQHFAITSNVAILMFFVAALMARAAIGVRHYPTLLIATGFAAMAGIFAVHGLSTPGVLQRGDRANDASLVVGLSAELALWVAGLFFAIRYTALAGWLERRVGPRALVAIVLGGVGAYAALALAVPSALGGLARWMLVSAGSSATYDPGSYGYGAPPAPDLFGGAGSVPYLVVASNVLLLGFAAYRQGRDWLKTRMPMQGALTIAYVLLAQAQVSEFLGPTWTPSWWEYHALMLVSALLALGAIFIELDRRRGLERFLPRTVVERVLQGDPLRLAGERQTVTILFADLRGSTALAERLSPEETVAVLNTYLRTMASCVMEAGGILDKFLGDGLMAIFGAMGDASHGADAAARAAVAMRGRLAALNAERESRGELPVRFGVGMHTGDVVLGAIGLPERSDYTAIGDTVNTASRMESLTKEFAVDAVLSEETAQHLESRAGLRPLGEALVKGKAAALRIFTLR